MTALTAIEAPAMRSARVEPLPSPFPSSAYGTVRSSAPMAMAPAKEPSRTGEAPAA